MDNRKLFITGQAKLNPEHMYKSSSSTQPLCLLLSFMHHRIASKNNAWVANNIVPLD